MTPKLLRAMIVSAFPLVGLSAAATTKFVGAYMTASEVPTGATIRECGNGNKDILALAAASDYLGGMQSNYCTINAYGTGTTNWNSSGCDNVTPFDVHRVWLVRKEGTNACLGMNGNSVNSTCWNTNFNTGTCYTTCNAVLNVKYSTDNGAHWSGCLNRTIQAYSFGKTE